MTTLHDIYDPPPAPLAIAPPEPEPIRWTRIDLAYLGFTCLLLTTVALLAWRAEPFLGIVTAISGTLVVLESWFASLSFLHRHPVDSPLQRTQIFLAALLPWAFGLGIAIALMAGLFALSDLLG
ncbi:MAG: hypothetical protein U0800_02665 [Isosphaeraceae bacterium]